MMIQDHDARQQALNPGQSFIIQAPAGSGKTELLTQRLLVLLADACEQPENIIAITFTKKAAREMKERVINALTFAKDNECPCIAHEKQTWTLARAVLKKDEELGWHILMNPNQLNILTIDSLTAKINAKTPLLSGMGIQPALVDQPASYYEMAARDCLISLSEKDAPLLSRLMLHLDNKVSRVLPLLCQLLMKREQWLPHIIAHRDDTTALKDLLESTLAQTTNETLSRLHDKLPAGLRQEWMDLAVHAGQTLADLGSETPLMDLPHPLTTDIQHLTHWQHLLDLVLTQEGRWRKTVTKKQGFLASTAPKKRMTSLLADCQTIPGLLPLFNDLKQCPTPHYSNTQWTILETLIEILPLLAAHLTIIFKRYNVIDFIELNLSALRALGSDEEPTDVGLYLDNAVTHCLIDEFQDTSITQYHLIRQLTQGWMPDDGRTLFLVGDPMQSIYRFRDAEVNLFLQTQQEGIGSIYLQPLTLTMNFRSDPVIVNWVNHTFSALFPATPDLTYGGVPLSSAIAARSDHTGSVTYSMHPKDQDTEPQSIISSIQSLQTQYPDDSIAILVRTRSQLHDIIPLLRAHQIDTQAIDIDPLMHRPEIMDLLSLTKAYYRVDDRIAWLSLLRAPWCGLSLHDLYQLAQYDPGKPLIHALKQSTSITSLSQAGQQQLHRLIPIIQQALAHRGRLPLSQVIYYLWLNLGGPQCLQDKRDLSHVQTYIECLEALETSAKGFSIEQLEERLASLYAPPISTTKNPIQIMTIHKSKGLEFDHVIMPHLEKAGAVDKHDLITWIERPAHDGSRHLLLAPIKSSHDAHDPIYQYLHYMQKKKSDYEIVRLMYVAATRAKKTLLLSASVKLHKKTQAIIANNASSFLCLLNTVYADQFNQSLHYQSSSKHETLTEKKYLKRLPIDHRFTQDYTEQLTSSQPPNPVTLAIHCAEDIARIKGIALHKALQFCDKKSNQEATTSFNQFRAIASQSGIQHSAIDSTALWIQQIIKKELKSPFGQWLFGNTHQWVKNEISIHQHQNGNLRQHVIDKVLLDKDQQLWVIDFKSSQPKKDQSIDDFFMQEYHQYKDKMNTYATLVKSLYPDLPIRVVLYFPVASLHYEWETTLLEIDTA